MMFDLPELIPNLPGLSQIIVAALLGGLLGLEREWAGKPAGLRTHIFVAAGSAMLMVLGNELIESYRANEEEGDVRADPIRIIQAIVLGISFLGAGTIVHESNKQVEGLTTAGTIFMTAVIGIAVALDRAALATAVTLLALMTLVVLGWIEHLFEERRRANRHS